MLLTALTSIHHSLSPTHRPPTSSLPNSLSPALIGRNRPGRPSWSVADRRNQKNKASTRSNPRRPRSQRNAALLCQAAPSPPPLPTVWLPALNNAITQVGNASPPPLTRCTFARVRLSFISCAFLLCSAFFCLLSVPFYSFIVSSSSSPAVLLPQSPPSSRPSTLIASIRPSVSFGLLSTFPPPHTSPSLHVAQTSALLPHLPASLRPVLRAHRCLLHGACSLLTALFGPVSAGHCTRPKPPMPTT